MNRPESASLALWRLAQDLSVEDAAILIAGGDPSETESVGGSDFETVKKTTGHPGFVAASSALKAAIRRKDLKAQLAYSIERAFLYSYSTVPLPDHCLLSCLEFNEMVSNVLDGDVDNPFADQSDEHGAVLYREPVWDRSTVDVDDLKAWLRSRGFTTGFFFPRTEAEPDDFLDNAHDHFAPELALAVTAWRALASERRFPRGSKAAIENWIAKNPDAWQGDEELGERAKERIATLVNWNSKGGVPKSRG